MSLLTTIKKTAAVVGTISLEILKRTPVPVSINTDTVNKAIANALPAGIIKTLHITSHEGYFDVAAQVTHRTGTYHVCGAFEVIKVNISKHEQRVTLKPRNQISLRGSSWHSRWNAFLYKLMGRLMSEYDPIKTELAKIPGFYFGNHKWTIDLAELGFRTVVEKLVCDKLHTVSSPLSSLAAPATGVIFNNVMVEEIRPFKDKFLINIRYLG